MLPYRILRRTRTRAYATYGLILANIVVFLWELTIPDARLFATFYDIAVVPCQLATAFFAPKTWLDTFRSMFLHAGVLHLAGNMLFLVLFGPSVEEYFGTRRFLAVYLLCGLAAVWTHTAVRAATGPLACSLGPILGNDGFIPLVGASGAIAGVMGGFILLYPGVNVRVSVPILRILPLNVTMPALFVLGYWFALQLLNGWLSIGPSGAQPGGGVAFWAHVGGFVTGAITVFVALLARPAPPQEIIEPD